jgi:hypothetical protein
MLTFPLNKVPIIPFKLTGILEKEIDKLLKQVIDQVTAAVKEAIALPDELPCDDPRIEALRKRIEAVNALVTKLQEILPIVDKISSGLNTIVGIANSIKALQLLNPVTAPAIIASELILAQNLTIANAGEAVLNLAQGLVPKINASLQDAVLSLVPVVNIISQKCNDDSGIGLDGTAALQQAINDLDYGDSIPGYPGGRWILISGSGENGSPTGKPPAPPSPFNDGKGTWFYSGDGYENPNGISWGSEQSRNDDATIGTEFYTETNVSIDDIKQQLETSNAI